MHSARLIIFGACLSALVACGGGGTSDRSASTNSSSAGTGNSYDDGVAPPEGVASGKCQASQVLGSARNDNLRIDAVRFLQVVEQDASSATIVSNKPLKLRVDILANAGTLAPVRRQALVYNPSSDVCQRYELSGPNTVPTTVDNTTLANAYTVDLPSALIQPGLTITIVLDDNQGRSSAEAAQVLRVVTPAKVLTGVQETIRIIPLVYDQQTGYASEASVKSIIERTFGVSSVMVKTESPLEPSALKRSNGFLIFPGTPGRFNSSTMEDVLDEVDDECDRLNGAQRDSRSAPKCLGVFPDSVSFTSSGLASSGQIVGIAYVGGKSMLAQSVSGSDVGTITTPYAGAHWLTLRAVTVAHEYGHLLNLDHASCGVSGQFSASKNYSDGRIGSTGAGYDAVRGFYFSARQKGADNSLQFGDLMSYCEKEWPSDRGYRASATYRAGGTSSRELSAREVPTKRWLKISNTDGQWTIRAVYTAPSSLDPTTMRMNLTTVDGLHELLLQRARIADLPLANSNGPYYVELPTNAVASLSASSWQLLGSAGQLITSGLGELLH